MRKPYKRMEVTSNDIELVRKAKDKDHLVRMYLELNDTLLTNYLLNKLWKLKVELPKKIEQPVTPPKHSDNIPDVGKTTVNILTEIRMLKQVVVDIAHLQEEQLTFFKSHVKRIGDKDGDNTQKPTGT